MTPTTAQELAEAVVVDGFGAHKAALAALFAGARRRGVSETLVSIAADPFEVDVVRLRALGRVVVDYVRAVECDGCPPAEASVRPTRVRRLTAA